MIDRRLTVLRMVAETGTVTATARALSYTPSAVSHQLKTLSEDLGVVVVEQHGRGMRLTHAGTVLLRHAHELSARWEQMRGEILEAGEEHQDDALRLCGFSTAAGSLLPAAAGAVRRAFPESMIGIIEADPEECFELLLAERADVAVVVATEPLPARNDPRFQQRDLLSDPLDLLVPADHRLARESAVPLVAAANEDWIMDKPGSTYHRLVAVSCAAAGFQPVAAHLIREWETGAALVAAGMGVSLVPRLARLPAGHDVVRVPLTGDPVPSRRILTGIRRGSDRRPMVAAALAALDESAREIEETRRPRG
ncbi:LysR family transcriptional regulator [Brevibacterium jeotgali]|uniref:DNA-binding transcriptional regulator, LysR family n=1 Tax=Brevibacterium jeotgali TaxID=1262550 RepID=A0A2H1L3X5_9MICO|nr:LysR family transcriptional regulator [Brevibacterium jeotgali]TWC01690.1 DNA-binding transcriptional LysR family regulator [Brevibacterium jeotgali]SMY11435.1 DNA-binding transcriptional regulator, LysR family [Brevibacterium jeotgali]